MEFSDDVVVQGTLRAKGGILGYIPREKLTQDNLKAFNIPLTELRVWDAFGSLLPTTGAADDLGLAAYGFATGMPVVSTGNLAGAGDVTRYARFTVQLPHNYVPGETVMLRAHAGFTNDGYDTASGIDFQAYLSNRDEDSLITGSDLVTTAEQTVTFVGNWQNYDFTLTPTALVPGAFLDCRMALRVNDTVAGGGYVNLAVTNLELLCDVKG